MEDMIIGCAECMKVVCGSEASDKGPENCPTVVKSEIIQEAMAEYDKPEIREFARQASIQEFECYMFLPQGRTPVNPRVEEIAQFAKKMGYKRLGMAFCGGLREEAQIFNKILENRGFEVVSVCCKTGGVAKERIGLKKEQKIWGPEVWESMCNPIS